MNTIDSIGGIGGMERLLPIKPLEAPKPEQKGLFESFFDAAMKVYGETNESVLQSEKLYVDLATGKTDDVLSVILAQEKATASLNFTVQVTSRIIEAYREIIRLQI